MLNNKINFMFIISILIKVIQRKAYIKINDLLSLPSQSNK